jgi:hypothetical protein
MRSPPPPLPPPPPPNDEINDDILTSGRECRCSVSVFGRVVSPLTYSSTDVCAWIQFNSKKKNKKKTRTNPNRFETVLRFSSETVLFLRAATLQSKQGSRPSALPPPPAAPHPPASAATRRCALAPPFPPGLFHSSVRFSLSTRQVREHRPPAQRHRQRRLHIPPPPLTPTPQIQSQSTMSWSSRASPRGGGSRKHVLPAAAGVVLLMTLLRGRAVQILGRIHSIGGPSQKD